MAVFESIVLASVAACELESGVSNSARLCRRMIVSELIEYSPPVVGMASTRSVPGH